MKAAGTTTLMKFNTRRIAAFLLLFFSLLIASGCATQHKYKKIKAVPCPCEKNFRK
jgi:hypothetical protein